jgi:hypothetical protein
LIPFQQPLPAIFTNFPQCNIAHFSLALIPIFPDWVAKGNALQGSLLFLFAAEAAIPFWFPFIRLAFRP